jgi:hypothetical protein
VKYWEIIAQGFSAAGWSWGCVSMINSNGQTSLFRCTTRRWKRFIVAANEKLSAFAELEREMLTVTLYLESIRADAGG